MGGKNQLHKVSHPRGMLYDGRLGYMEKLLMSRFYSYKKKPRVACTTSNMMNAVLRFGRFEDKRSVLADCVTET